MAQPDWDERYSRSDFAYGTQANAFLEQNANLLSGSILSIAEGEGRNAVFLATLGHRVHAVDGSSIGLAKANELAQRNNVSITTEVANLEDYQPPESTFDAVVSIYAHLSSSTRLNLYPLLVEALKPGGICILEAYSEKQRDRDTGGPRDLDQLMTCSKIEREFEGLETVLLKEVDRDVREGKYHTGMASVVQYIGKKSV
ncbi:class I SAM-dependent methyltransferase [Rhodopirellula bahusiensis]|uniref:SAM-dependent methyltransferase n=1 Tax=Rhodopirellula bahusiensis TaxID=2014065 RepID=A0A2G1W083_9BACT|nr:class I SAM-dependent methyltransferase [Rhodopirellula bahusiensis]PHQ32260.1 SAM-dependent methyltransferase [Rhodopirellula bahusiensis]